MGQGPLKMGQKMPWLKTRLREINKTPAGLAKHLLLYAPRIYEMIAGRRQILPGEIVRMAEFLEWPVEELLQHMPEDRRVLPTTAKSTHHFIPVLGSMPALLTTNYDATLTGETQRHVSCGSHLEGRNDLFAVYIHGTKMSPWRDEGEIVLAEKERPPAELDHVVIVMAIDDRKHCLVRQLLHSSDAAYRVRQHCPGKTTSISKKAVSSIYRVMTWDDVIR